MRISAKLAAAVLLLVSLAQCRGCRDAGPKTILGLVDANAVGVMHIPDVGRLGRGVDAFIARAMRKASPRIIKTLREKIIGQLGFDPLRGEQWRKGGINPAAGIALFTEGRSPEIVAALGIADRKTFDAALIALVERVDGANKVETIDAGGYSVTTIGRPFGDMLVPVIHWTHLGDYVLITWAADPVPLHDALKRLQPTGATKAFPTLDADAGYIALRKKVPEGDLFFLLRATADAMPDSPLGVLSAIGAESMTSVRVTGTGLSSETFIAAKVPGLDKALAGEPPLELASQVGEDAIFVLLTRAARTDGIAALRSVPAIASAIDRSIAPIKSSTGIDPEKDALPNFVGPLTVGVYLHDLGSLATRIRSRSLAALLDVVQVSVAAKVKDPAATIAMLEKSRAALGERGLTIRKRVIKIGDKEATLFEPDRDTPRFGWGVIGDTYYYGAGTGRLQRSLEAAAIGPSSLPAVFEKTVTGVLAKEPGASVIVLRAGALADAVAQAKLGTALSGIVGSIAEVVRALGDIAMSLTAEPDGLRIKLREQLQ